MMKAFTQIAIPHEDVAKGRLTMDVFAADLWQVVQGRAPLDYQDPDRFFQRTYITEGLKNILEVAKARLEGKSGDSVIQLQTPFGGGKTHTLIALYHKAKEWKANVVVIEGVALDPKEQKPWEVIERQLTGAVKRTQGNTAPGKEKLVEVLSIGTPVLILMDEVLQYITKAAGIKIGDSNLAAQTFAFIQELTAAVSTVGNALLVLTLPSSALERYDENAERTFQQLQKITGRMEKIYAPVKDDEIEHVVRARLFSSVDEGEAKAIVDAFVDYAKKEGLLSGDEVSEYRNRFLKSYPFKPEVIDILYKRWGSFPTFQRTRGVLRLLSLVIYKHLENPIPYIRLGDLDLGYDELRRELIKHIGQEWDSIIAQDITKEDSGAKKVDKALGTAYMPYKLGTVISTTIFMTSFSGKGEGDKGLSIKEIKLNSLLPGPPASVIDEVINKLREKLFYLSDEGLFFTNQPNLNRILISKEENITSQEIQESEKEMLEKHIDSKSRFRIFIYPQFPKDIPDSPEFKLVILNTERPDKAFLEKCGESPRVYRNTLIFLCVEEHYKEHFSNYLKKLLALKGIKEDRSLNLTESQVKEVEKKLKHYEQKEYEELRKYYRKLFLPEKDQFKEVDLGLPDLGSQFLDKEIDSRLRSEGELLDRITPRVIKEKYLSNRDYLEVGNLYEVFLSTPGALRLKSKADLVEAIEEGVREGLFGFGSIENGIPQCEHLKEEISLESLEGKIIIKPELCQKEKATSEVSEPSPTSVQRQTKTELKPSHLHYGGEAPSQHRIKGLALKLKVPHGNISTIVRIINNLKDKFENCDVEMDIRVTGGELDPNEYERIDEALRQANVTILDEKLE